MEYLFIIYSCKKNINNAEKLYSYLIDKLNVDKILIINGLIKGDYNDDIEKEIILNGYKIIENKLILNISDTYEYLNLKTHQLFKTIYNLYPNIKGIFKCDDDIIPNIQHLNNFIYNILSNNNFNSNIDYCGNIINTNNYWSKHHLFKVNNIKFKKPIYVPKCTYCAGPLYYLSNKSVKILSDNNLDCSMFFEDVMVGLNLCKKSIQPYKYNLYSDNITDLKNISYHNNNHMDIKFL